MRPTNRPTPASDLLHRALRAAFVVLLAGLAGFALAAALRYGLIERDELGIACESGATGWRCDLRLLVIQAFLHHVFALASIAAAALAEWRRSGVLAGLAVGAGVMGMMLYGFEWSALGVLAGTAVIARLQRDRTQDGEAERQH